MDKFLLVVAHDQDNGIGANNDLVWSLPEDMAWFKSLTIGNEFRSENNVVIMGRNTWDSIPDKYRPLPDRFNIVISRQPRHMLNITRDTYLCSSIESALELANTLSTGDVFVIGGASIYEQCIDMPNCAGIYVTKVVGNLSTCDVYFPYYNDTFRNEQVFKSGRKLDLKYTMSVFTK